MDAVSGAALEGIYLELARDCEDPAANCDVVDRATTDAEGEFQVTELSAAPVTVDLFVNLPRAGRPDSLFRSDYGSARRSFQSQRTHRVYMLLQRVPS